jgi:hypothetical protein
MRDDIPDFGENSGILIRRSLIFVLYPKAMEPSTLAIVSFLAAIFTRMRLETQVPLNTKI